MLSLSRSGEWELAWCLSLSWLQSTVPHVRDTTLLIQYQDEILDNRPTKKRRIYGYKYCPHCKSCASKSTYYAHSKTQKEILVDDCDSFSDETANCSIHVSSPLNLMAESSSTGEEGIPEIKYT